MRQGVGIAATVLAIVSSGCSSDGQFPTRAPIQPLPPYVDQVGVPVHAKASDGATADITLNSVSWLPDTCVNGGGVNGRSCAVVELTFVGTSPHSFRYHESFVTASVGPGGSVVGGGPDIDYTAIGKLPSLRLGSVVASQTVHGFVAIPIGGPPDHWYIEVTDPDNVGDTEAAWQVHP